MSISTVKSRSTCSNSYHRLLCGCSVEYCLEIFFTAQVGDYICPLYNRYFKPTSESSSHAIGRIMLIRWLHECVYFSDLHHCIVPQLVTTTLIDISVKLIFRRIAKLFSSRFPSPYTFEYMPPSSRWPLSWSTCQIESDEKPLTKQWWQKLLVWIIRMRHNPAEYNSACTSHDQNCLNCIRGSLPE